MHGIALNFVWTEVSSIQIRGSSVIAGGSVILKKFRELLLIGLALQVVAGLIASRAFGQSARNVAPPEPLREFRAAWIATRANIDWPSQQGLTPSQQKAELVAILNKAAQLKLNALIFQVRPSCDAFYASHIEPWSEYLSGTMGRAPEPFYDPLAFAIEQAHLRGLELHAWFNPFRARYSGSKSPVAANHVSRAHPTWAHPYGKQLWLDPGEPGVREYSTSVILDVLKRYDVDGIHLDDYFYPYKEKDEHGRVIDFPDDASWKHYRAGGGKLSRDDWRRKNVDDFVQHLYQRIKAEKRWVKFGISPFGIWRPGFPPQISGMDSYAEIYADSKKWMGNGWADYFSPQLYWSIRPAEHSFTSLLHWWAAQNTQKRHLWPGLNLDRVGKGWTRDEIVNQIRAARKEGGVNGQVLWNVSSLIANRGGLANALSKEAYAQPALIPPSPWLENHRPAAPQVRLEKDAVAKELRAVWTTASSESDHLWLLQFKTDGRWITEILPAKQRSRSWPMTQSHALPTEIFVAAVDRCGNLSDRVRVDISLPIVGAAKQKR